MIEYFDTSVTLTIPEDNEPLSPFMQLLLVLPEKDAHLLPVKLQKGFALETIKQVTPARIIIDFHGEEMGYKGYPLISFPDIHEVQQFVNEKLEELPGNEVPRNRRSHDVLFVNRYQQYYQTIQNETEICLSIHGIQGVLHAMKYQLFCFFDSRFRILKELKNENVFGYLFESKQVEEQRKQNIIHVTEKDIDDLTNDVIEEQREEEE